jgi:tetratricopeptide (TPR) repeat protein
MLDPNIENTQPAKPAPGENPEITQPVTTSGNTEYTQPTSIQPEPAGSAPVPAAEEEDTTPKKTERVRQWPWILAGIFLILLLGTLGGYIGYRTALQMRAAVSAEEIATVATEQFMLGLQEQAAGQYDLALKRFEYVIKLDPNFPSAQEKMTEVMMAIALSKTPTAAAPTALPTLTPTPDTRAEEEIFINARDLVNNKDWFAALDVLDTLRNKNINYRTIEVDGMYYTALRFRGLAKINTGNLEGGLYDLALVERFAPLDVDANGVRTWTRIYITGAAYWGVRWDRVVFYFEQIAPYFPGLRDRSGITANERYRIGLLKWGDQLAAEGKYCDAVDKYDASYQIGQDSALAPTATEVYNLCHPPEPTQAPTETPTITPTLGAPTPTETQPVVNTEVPTETPTAPAETPTETLPAAP